MIAALTLLMGIADAAPPAAGEHLLRYRFRAGASQTVTIHSTISSDALGSELRLELVRRIVSVHGDRARVELTLQEISFGEGAPRNGLYGKLRGTAWRGWQDHRGRFEALTVIPPKDLPPLLQPVLKAMDRLVPAQGILLPAEAVRIGDDWQLPAKNFASAPEGDWASRARGGLKATLRGVDGDRATIALSMQVEAGERSVLNGQGTLIVDLDGGMVSSLNLDSQLTITTHIAGDEKQRRVHQRLNLTSQQGVTP